MESRLLPSGYQVMPFVGPLQHPDQPLPNAVRLAEPPLKIQYQSPTGSGAPSINPTANILSNPGTALSSGPTKPFVGPIQYPRGHAGPEIPPPAGGGGFDVDVWIYNGAGAGDWNTPGNWLQGRVPTAVDEAYFGIIYDPPLGKDVGSNANCKENVTGGAVAGTLDMDSSYSGTLELDQTLDVGDGALIMAGGNISQPNGANSQITVSGLLNWTGGQLNNSGESTLEIENADEGDSVVDKAAAQTADTFEIAQGVTIDFESTLTQTVNFNNGAGITMEGGDVTVYESNVSVAIATSGSTPGLIQNNGGTFEDAGNGSSPVTINAAYVGTNGTLAVNHKLYFASTTSQGGLTASVFQNGGTTEIYNNAVLNSNQAYAQSSGNLNPGDVSTIGGTVSITGGAVNIGLDDALICNGNVTVSGGTYYANVDGGLETGSWWVSDMVFTIKDGASLNVSTTDVPDDWGTTGPDYGIGICGGTTGLTDTAAGQNKWPGGDTYTGWNYHHPGFYIQKGQVQTVGYLA
jgi:hypothetical protein